MADETLNMLLKAHGINDDTAIILADQGFVTEEAISVLTIGDIPSLKIKQLAQRRLLEKMIHKLEKDSAADMKEKEIRRDAVTLEPRRMDTSVLGSSMGATGSEHVTDSQNAPEISRTKDNYTTTSSSLSLDETVKQLIATASTATTPQHQVTIPGTDLRSLGINNVNNGCNSIRGDLNPLVYLADNKNADYLDIIDYVPSLCYESEEQVLSSQEGSEIVLKTGPKKPRLERVNQMQWTAASCRILAKLLLEGKIGVDGVAHYLSYTVKISCLAQRYVWATVLLYDREYRRAQANYNFPWGSDVPHLVSVHLVPRNDRIPGGGNSEKKDSFQSKQASGSARYQKPYPCNLFNTQGTCKYGSNCRFSHECNKCKGPHPGCEHPK
jgi:hypothetical protein